MKLLLSKPRGFCAGVERAIDTVKKALQIWGPPIYVKHEIVHNTHVVEELKAMGAVFIEDLKEVGWLSFSEGKWVSSASQIQFPDEVKSFVIRSFHGQMLGLAVEALEDDISEREFGAAVFTFPASEFSKLKEKLKELQRDLIGYVQDISSQVENPKDQKVYHFGVQCFSLQKGAEHEKQNNLSA